MGMFGYACTRPQTPPMSHISFTSMEETCTRDTGPCIAIKGHQFSRQCQEWGRDHCPVPNKLIGGGLSLALSERVTAAIRVPAAGGVKATVIVQPTPPARLVPQ